MGWRRKTMNVPEYLLLFTQSATVDVHIRFEGHDGHMPSRKMDARAIASLVTPDGTGFHRRMTFDDWECAVSRYEIDPINGSLTIVAKPLS